MQGIPPLHANRSVFHGKRHPETLGEPEVTAFLNHLAAERNVAASTQNQALSALLFFYKEVLGKELAWLDGLHRAKRPPRLPTVLTRAEVERLLAQPVGTHWLLASILYGRVIECLRLRVSCHTLRHWFANDLRARAEQGRARGCKPAGCACAGSPGRASVRRIPRVGGFGYFFSRAAR